MNQGANVADVGTGVTGEGDVKLVVNSNGGEYSEEQKSDFAIAEVMVWDRGLTSDEMYGVCDYLMKKFGIRRTKGIEKIRLQLQGTGHLHVGEVEAFDLNGRNIAIGRTVKESTTESTTDSFLANPSSNAVDGNPRTHTHTRYEAG